MSNSDERRWQQRLDNFGTALAQLTSACERDRYDDLERAGLIKTFEFCFELSWNVLKDLLYYEGHEVKVPRAAIRRSFEVDYIDEDDCEALLDALDKRNLLSHTYWNDVAREAEALIKRRKNVVQARSFAEMLEQTIRRYQSRAVEAAQVIEELIGLAREMREANARGERLGLSDDELAFYDALGVNDSAVQVLGDDTLRDIARELEDTVRRNVTIDWTLRENVRANLRRLVKRVLRKHKYPPDKQESATRTVLEQAEVLSAGWAT